jgi:hypothetical protein
MDLPTDLGANARTGRHSLIWIAVARIAGAGAVVVLKGFVLMFLA